MIPHSKLIFYTNMLPLPLRLFLSFSFITPISLSWAYIELFNEKDNTMAIILIVSFFIIILFVYGIIKYSQRKIADISINITKVKNTDKEIVSFCMSYLLPIFLKKISIPDIYAFIFSIIILAFILAVTHAIPVNPILGILGYHFYEIDSSSNIGYILITKRKITHVQQVKKVIRIGECTLLETEE